MDKWLHPIRQLHLDADVGNAGQPADAAHEVVGDHAAVAALWPGVQQHTPVLSFQRLQDGVAPEARHIEQRLQGLQSAQHSASEEMQI